jgi:hypothetical protein
MKLGLKYRKDNFLRTAEICWNDFRNVVRQQTIGKSEDEQSDAEEVEQPQQPGDVLKLSLNLNFGRYTRKKLCSVTGTIKEF